MAQPTDGFGNGPCEGGQNPPLGPNAPRPPTPKGSGGATAPDTETANSRRLKRAHAYLDQLWREAESNKLYGHVTVKIPFQDGEAQDVLHEKCGRERLA